MGTLWKISVVDRTSVKVMFPDCATESQDKSSELLCYTALEGDLGLIPSSMRYKAGEVHPGWDSIHHRAHTHTTDISELTLSLNACFGIAA